MTQPINFQSINQEALGRLPELLLELLPGGRIDGHEYRCGDLTGGPGDSMGVNLDTGRWADFADTVKGGDVVSLVAAIHRCDQGDAARWLESWLGIDRPAPAIRQPKPTTGTWTTIPAPVPPAAIHHPRHGNPSATWEYRGMAGEILGIVCRFDQPDGEKEVIPYTHGIDATGKAGWKWRAWPEPRPLYGLDRLAQRPDAPVLIVEGEKTADAAQRLLPAAVAVSWPGGSNATGKADFSPLKGRRAAIWPDNDEPGRKAAEAVARAALAAGAAEVFIVDVPPGMVETWDLADAEAEGWTPGQVAEWIKSHHRKVEPAPMGLNQDQPPAVDKECGAPTAGGSDRVRPVGIHEFLSFEFPPRENLLSPWLPSQGLAMVYAARGIGKTHFALGVAYAVASGGRYLGWQSPTPAGVLYIDGETPGAVMQERLAAIAASNALEAVAPFEILNPDLQPNGMPRIDTPDGQAEIESILTPEIKLIIIDNISTLTQTKENEADGWTPVQAWALRQRSIGRSVLFVHHAGKGGQQRGTSRREDVLDTVLSLRRPVDYHPDQGAVFEVHFEKARGIYGDDVKPIEASLTTNDDGLNIWGTRTVEAGTFDRVVQLLNEGMKQHEIVAELGVNKSTISRHVKRAKAEGLAVAA